MDRQDLDSRTLAAAQNGGGREALLEPPPSVGGSAHALIAQIEQAIEQYNEEVGPRLEALFEAAESVAPDPPPGMLSYLERKGVPTTTNRRRKERATLLARVIAIPLSSNGEPRGEPFKAIARDASEGGLCLLYTRAVTADRLALRWQELAAARRTITVLLRVVRCGPMGPFYELGGVFEAVDDGESSAVADAGGA